MILGLNSQNSATELPESQCLKIFIKIPHEPTEISSIMKNGDNPEEEEKCFEAIQGPQDTIKWAPHIGRSYDLCALSHGPLLLIHRVEMTFSLTQRKQVKSGSVHTQTVFSQNLRSLPQLTWNLTGTQLAIGSSDNMVIKYEGDSFRLVLRINKD